LKARKIRLIETTPEESAAAIARLDEVRKKRRERHAKNNRNRKSLFENSLIDMSL
jgi:hypothetical protein